MLPIRLGGAYVLNRTALFRKVQTEKRFVYQRALPTTGQHLWIAAPTGVQTYMPYETEQPLKSYLDTNQLGRERLCLAVLSVDRRFSDVRPRHPA